jgi:hypothetical protein
LPEIYSQIEYFRAHEVAPLLGAGGDAQARQHDHEVLSGRAERWHGQLGSRTLTSFPHQCPPALGDAY